MLDDGYPPADKDVASILGADRFKRPEGTRSLEQILFIACILERFAEWLELSESSYADTCRALWDHLETPKKRDKETMTSRGAFIECIVTEANVLLDKSHTAISRPAKTLWDPVKELMRKEEEKASKKSNATVQEYSTSMLTNETPEQADYERRENFVEISNYLLFSPYCQ